MNTDIAITGSILAIAILLFATEWLRADAVAVLVTVSLAATRVLTPEEAFSGFSSEAVIAIAALLVIGEALVRTGVVRWMAERLHHFIKGHRFRLKLIGTAVPGIISGFINNVAAVSIFIPLVLRLSRKNRINPSKLLLPMAAAALTGANLSLIGASQNLVANSLLAASGNATFGFFEFTLLGAPILAVVLVYCLVAGNWLLPEGEPGEDEDDCTECRDLLQTYGIGERFWEVWVRPGASVSDKTVNDVGIGKRYGLSILLVLRDGGQLSVESGDFRLKENDVLALIGRSDRIEALAAENDGIVLLGQPDPRDEFSWSAFDIVDVVVPPRSNATGKTLRQMRFREITRLSGIALWHEGGPLRTEVRDRPLRPGDAILFFGTREAVRNFTPTPDFVWLNPPSREEAPLEMRRLAPVALAIFVSVILFAALDWLPVAVAAMAGAAAAVFSGILTPKHAYRSIDWKTVVIVAGMYPMGQALDKSGAAALVAGLLGEHVGALGPLALMAGIALVSIFLTQVMHSAVVAVIMIPVAVQAAAGMSLEPKAFAISVIIGASAAVMLPVGDPAVMLVQRPGGYATTDYIKFGAGLVVLVFAVLMLVAPLIWPLKGA